MSVSFEIIGTIQNIETIAVGSSIRVLPYVQKVYGQGRRRKLKGTHKSNYRTAEFNEWNSTGMRLTVLDGRT